MVENKLPSNIFMYVKPQLGRESNVGTLIICWFLRLRERSVQEKLDSLILSICYLEAEYL